MTAEEFKQLIGEEPEDMFGGDWENEIEKLELESKMIYNYYGESTIEL